MVLKKGEKVKVIVGKDKGKNGEIIEIDRVRNLAKVKEVNMQKKHKKANPNAGEQGGIVSQEAPIQASNVAIWNHKDSRADKVQIKLENGEKFRVFKSSGDRVED